MIEIGNNFLYRGPLFLDYRHGLANTKDDLLRWNIPVPEGFEVYLNSMSEPGWYTYKSSVDLPDTGHFERRVDKSYIDNSINGIEINIVRINNQINDIWDAIDNLNISPNLVLEIESNGGTYLVGTPVTPEISWVLKNYGAIIDNSEFTDVKINGNSIGSVSSWEGSPIYNTSVYTITVTYNGVNIEQQVSYNFEQHYSWVKYFGISSEQSLTSLSSLQQIFSEGGWGTSDLCFEGTANCWNSSANYPYYIVSIPYSTFDSTMMRVYVGGVRTTDISCNGLVVDGIQCTAIRTGYIQTGILRMKYEYECE